MTSNKTTQKITLQHPFTWESKQVKELTLRAPKVKDMLAARKTTHDEAEQELAMFANLAEVLPEMIHEMYLGDYMQLQKAYTGFLSSAPSKPGPCVSDSKPGRILA